jgi:opacity protein-like surface antigen
MNRFGVVGLGVIGLCAASAVPMTAHAQDDDMSSNAMFAPSLDLGISAAYYKANNAKIYDRDVTAPDNFDHFDHDHVTGKGFVGVNLNKWLGVEAQYIYLGKDEKDDFKLKGNGYTGAVVLSLPIGDHFAIFAKGGEFWWNIDVNGPAGFDTSKDGHDPFYGAGVKFKLTQNFAIRAEYERVKLDKSDSIKLDLDLASAGIEFIF